MTLPILLIGEDHFIAMTIKSEITIPLPGSRGLGRDGHLTCDRRVGRHAVTEVAEFDEIPLPAERERKTHGIETGGFVALLHGDALGHHHGTAPKHPAE